MKELIEKVLKEKIGTQFEHRTTSEGSHGYIALTTYGKGIIIVPDVATLDKTVTRVGRLTEELVFIIVEQNLNYEHRLTWAIKAMIQLQKESK